MFLAFTLRYVDCVWFHRGAPQVETVTGHLLSHEHMTSIPGEVFWLTLSLRQGDAKSVIMKRHFSPKKLKIYFFST